MSELSRLESIEAASKSNKEADIASKKADQPRVEVTKNKKSQLVGGGVSNVVSFKENVKKQAFTISINVTGKGEGSEEALIMFQQIVTEFLSDIHTNI